MAMKTMKRVDCICKKKQNEKLPKERHGTYEALRYD